MNLQKLIFKVKLKKGKNLATILIVEIQEPSVCFQGLSEGRHTQKVVRALV